MSKATIYGLQLDTAVNAAGAAVHFQFIEYLQYFTIMQIDIATGLIYNRMPKICTGVFLYVLSSNNIVIDWSGSRS